MKAYESDQYDIELSEDSFIIMITPKRDIDRQFAREFRKRANQLAETNGSHRFLVDVRHVHSIGSSGDRFIYAYKDAPSTGFLKTSKVAMVRSPDDMTHAFICTVMTRAGFNYAMFTDMKQAEDWLRL